MAIWAFVTCPPDYPAAARRNYNALQVSIPDRVPLQLQHCIQEGQVWLLLLLLSCCVAPPLMLLQLNTMLKADEHQAFCKTRAAEKLST